MRLQKKDYTKIYLILISIILSSCMSANKLIYFEDLKNQPELNSEITNKVNPTIQPDDLLGVFVNSLNPESNILFNNGTLISSGDKGGVSSTKQFEGYLVDQTGNINFPVIGKIKVANLTIEEATEKITLQLKKYVKDPIVNIRFLNFKITVLGEVNRPSSYNIQSERINIIEALGLAGDMTVYGKRENVLIIREKNGKRNTARLNLLQKETLNSPYFYLQQNDIVYVEPDKVKAEQRTNFRSNIGLVISVVSFLLIILRT